MRRWFQTQKARLRRHLGREHAADRGPEAPILELLVLTGADAGQRFTLSGDESAIGRRLASEQVRGGVLLRDATVSARQAVVRNQEDGPLIEHEAEATNPTRVNGAPIQAARLRPGDHIEFGEVEIEVCSRGGASLRELTEAHVPTLPLSRAVPSPGGFRTRVVEPNTREIALDDMLNPPLPASEVGWLELVESERAGDEPPRRFPLRADRTRIGRGADSDVRLDDLGVSREHTELVWEGRHLVLYHKSATNLTLVNRREVPARLVVRHDDEITLAGRVRLRLDIHPAFRSATSAPASSPGGRESTGLRGAMEHKAALERRIAEEFSVEGSFFDLDVVNSMGMKKNIEEPGRIVLSFERFRSFVGRAVAEHEGHVLNSNGDELMCFFAQATHALAAAHRVFDRLDAFNREENLLDIAFAFRVGIHSGRSLVDLKRGIAYSATLDVAGHLQKLAPTNRVAISEHTRSALPETTPLEWAGRLEREGFDYYLVEDAGTGPGDGGPAPH